MYHEGFGVPKDYDKAYYWIGKSADQGNTIALNDLGRAYANGEGKPKDAKKAFEYYRQSAEKGIRRVSTK